MKKIFLILILFLTSCASKDINLQEKLQNKINSEITIKTFTANHRKPYYSYYVDPSVGNIYSDKTTNMLDYNGIKFFMNLNISKIINNKYYNEINDYSINFDDKLLFTLDGLYKNYEGKELIYKCNLYNIDDKYMINFISDSVDFYSVGTKLEMIEVVSKMVQISKSIKINEEAIISNYSSKENIQFKKENLNLFETIVPVNGNIQDIIEGSNIEENSENITDNTEQVDDNYSTDDYKN